MKLFKSLLIVLCFLLVMPLSTHADSITNEVKQYVKNEYVGNLSGNLNAAKTVEEVMRLLDVYSTHFTAAEFEEYLQSIEMTAVGIGVVIEETAQGILITEVLKDGSADQAGLHIGDIIVKINDQSTKGMSIQDASSAILGTENTAIQVSIQRNGKIQLFTLTRKQFQVENVSTGLLSGGVGVITLRSFSEDTIDLVKTAYTQLKKDGATSIILDIQNNGGGYVTAAEQLIGMFPKASLAYTLKTAKKTRVYSAIRQSVQFPVNTRILINRNSASASEMLAAALVDQQAAVVYGEKSYGKGTMQSFFELSDGSVLKLTIGQFSGPKGSIINQIGVVPTVKTETPLITAHADALIEKYHHYKSLFAMKAEANKKFTIRFNKQLAPSQNPGAIELIELGSNKTIDYTLQQQDKQLILTPKEPLRSKGQYMLFIHPTVKDSKGRTLTQGSYLTITGI